MSGVGGDRFFGGGVGNLNNSMMTPGGGHQAGGNKKSNYTCWKLLVDPVLVKGAAKLYRFDGNVPDDPCYPPITLRDPRNSLYLARLRNRSENLELPTPRFKIDANYVGTPPPLEVTITNINDNVDKGFLKDMLQKFGSIEEIQIYYHPVTKKHLGLGRIVFEYTKGAKMCVEKMHGKSVMGQVLDAFVDPFGTRCKAIFEELTTERPKEVKPKVDKTKTELVDKLAESKPLSTPSTYNNSQSSGQPRVHSSKPDYTPSSDMGYGTGNSENSNYSETSSLKSSYGQYGNQYEGSYNMYNHQYPGMRQAPPNPSYGSPKQGSMWNQPASSSSSSKLPYRENDSKTEDNGGYSPKMDLDTRIKMLLGGNSAHNISVFFDMTDDESENSNHEPEQPAKIQKSSRKRKTRVSLSKNEIWGSESEEETEEDKFAKKFKKNTFVPIDGAGSSQHDGHYGSSPPPSPFLSLSKPRNNGIKASAIENDLDQISDDSVELPGSKRDDDMSLSSLSPEDPSTIRLPPCPPPPLPVIEQPCVPHIPSYPPPHINHNYYPGAPQYPGNNHLAEQQHLQYSSPYFAQWSQQGPTHNVQMHQQHHYYSHYQMVPPPPPPESSQAPQENQEVEEKDTTGQIISTVLDRLVEELKQILKRDFQKRMIENVAYKSFENWWSQNEKQQKEQQANKTTTIETPVPDSTTFTWTAGRFIEQEKPMESNFSLGLKATIPKLPSFRRKIRTPSPTLMDEDSRRSMDDSDLEESKSSSDSRARRRRRPLSLSSDQSSSDSSSSDSSSSDWDSDLSSSETLESFSDNELVFPEKEKSDIRDLLLETESISDESTHSTHKSQTSTPRHPLTPEPLDEDEEECRIINKTNDNLVQNLDRVNGEDTLLSQEDAIRREMEEIVVQEQDKVIEDMKEEDEDKEPEIASYLLDHDYCIKWSPLHAQVDEEEEENSSVLPSETTLAEEFKNLKKERASKANKALLVPKTTKRLQKAFAPRNEKEELDVTFEFLTKGIDEEDISFIKQSYELMLAEDPENFWLNQTHWVDHPPTLTPNPKPKSNKRVHLTGSARTEGFYKLDHEEKQKHKLHLSIATAVNSATGRVGVNALSQDKPAGKTQTLSREARSNQRRLLTALGNDVESDLLKFNQLKFRKKSLRFARSCIHDWGLFAAEPIAADEMVIEYVGQTIRPIVADLRERKYEAVGIGSSYLFRIDLENIIDATRCGNLSRFINHSCSPNCYAKIIAIEGQKKIVIYSKQQIAMNEEITYDYKFPIEDEKITCLCGSTQCRGTLN